MTTRTEHGERLGHHLTHARLATWDHDGERLQQATQHVLALLERGQPHANQLEEAYLEVVREAILVTQHAAQQGRWQLAEDAVDAVHNVGRSCRSP